MHARVMLSAAVGAAVAAGCGSALQASPPATEPNVYIDAVSTEDERTQLASLIREAHATLGSATFRENLLALKTAYPRIYANPAWTRIDVDRLAAILSLEEPDTRYVRLPVALRGSESYGDGGTGFNYIGSTGSVHWNGEDPVGAMSLGRVNMFRYRQDNIVDRSCAINTMAHEITHTISRTPGKYIYAIADTAVGSLPADTSATASYLVGSVAQCTWLQAQGRIGAADVPKCVGVFGVKEFNNPKCPEFEADEPIE